MYYKIDNESLSNQRETCNKVGSGFTLGTPEKVQQRCFWCSQWEPQPRHIICPSNIGTLDIKRLCNKAEWKKEKEIFVFFFQILQIFIIKSAYISKS